MSSVARLAAPVVALSVIGDLAKGLGDGQAMRTCVLAVRLADRMQLPSNVAHDIFWVALLRFVGCTATASEMADALDDEIAVSAAFAAVDTRDLRAVMVHASRLVGGRPDRLLRLLLRAPSVIRRHEIASCEVAQLLSAQLGLSAGVCAALRSVFERFDGRGNPGILGGERIPLPARVEQVAHLAELLSSTTSPNRLVTLLRGRAGGMLDPQAVEAFAANATDLIGGLDQIGVEQVLSAEPQPQVLLAADSMDDVARSIGAVVDMKSPFLLGHSDRVAQLAASAATVVGLPAPEVDQVRWAGWLHDVGRAGISSHVWDKPGPLSSTEWERVRLHAYLSRRVVASVPGWASLADLVAAHHERVDGSGYHAGTPGPRSLKCEILAAADVFAALGERRPHRNGYPQAERALMLRAEVTAGRLHGQAVEAVLTASGAPRAGRARPVSASPPSGLTDRELQVLTLVARGCTNQAVARRLGISPKTVNTHLEHVFTKFGVSSRAAAVFQAAQSGLVQDVIG